MRQFAWLLRVCDDTLRLDFAICLAMIIRQGR